MTTETTGSVLRVNPKSAQTAMAILMKARITPVLVGPPGGGKTAAVKDFTKALNKQGVEATLLTKCLAQLDISNFSLPKEIEARIHEICAKWIPLESDEVGDDPYTILFFDEIDRCGSDVQNIILNIILAREVASQKISDKVIFVGAMNGSSDMYCTELSDAAVNRVCLLYMGNDAGSYDEWAAENGISPLRRAFGKFKADEVLRAEEAYEDVSFASNRSLDAVDKIDQIVKSIKANPQSNLDTDSVFEPIVAGLIGTAACNEYMSFKRLYDEAELPDVILANPKAARIDYTADLKYAVLLNVFDYAGDDDNLCEKALQFVSRLEAEYIATGMAVVQKNNDNVVCCPTFVKLHKTMG